jgi:hypothetical protein
MQDVIMLVKHGKMNAPTNKIALLVVCTRIDASSEGDVVLGRRNYVPLAKLFAGTSRLPEAAGVTTVLPYCHPEWPRRFTTAFAKPLCVQTGKKRRKHIRSCVAGARRARALRHRFIVRIATGS